MAIGTIKSGLSLAEFNEFNDQFGTDGASSRIPLTNIITPASTFTIDSSGFLYQTSPNVYWIWLQVIGAISGNASKIVATAKYKGHPLVGQPAMYMQIDSGSGGYTGMYSGSVLFDTSGNVTVYNFSTAGYSGRNVICGPLILDLSVNLT